MATENVFTTIGGETLYQNTTSEDESKEIEALYAHVQKLTDATDKKEAASSYTAFLEAVKGGTKVKILAAQFIPRFYKYFPDFADQSINALLDLIEEDDIPMRVHAIKGLAGLCISTPENVGKIADVLAQLLVAEEHRELDAAKRALCSLARIDIIATLGALFNQITIGEEDPRTQAIHFIKDKLMPLADELIKPNPPVEDNLSAHIMKVLPEATEEEFKIFFEILSKLKKYSESSVELIDVIAQHTGIGVEGKEVDVEKALAAVSNAGPLFKKAGVGSNSKFFKFLVSKALVNFSQQPEQTRLNALRVCAEISPYTSGSDARAALPEIYKLLQAYMPLKTDTEPDINFSYLEYLLYTFHQLALRAPGSLHAICGIKIVTGQPQDMTSEDHSSKLKDFQARLSYLEEKASEYKLKLKKSTSDGEQTPELKRQKEMASKLIDNLIRMVSTLKKAEPQFLTSNQIALSWKTVASKRAAEEDPVASTSNNNNSKRARTEAYVPPHRQGEPPKRGAKTGNTTSDNKSGATRGRGRGGRGGRGGSGGRGKRIQK